MKKEERFDAPPLPKLSMLSSSFVLRVVFQGCGAKDKTAYALSVNFVRLVDQAVRSYESARAALIVFVSTYEHIAWGKVESGVSDFEQCIVSIHRAVAMAKGLINYEGTPTGLRHCFPESGVILPEVIERQIRRLRNTLHHFDEKLLKGKIQPKEAIVLVPARHTLELGSRSLSYHILIDAITSLHPMADAVSRFREDTPS